MKVNIVSNRQSIDRKGEKPPQTHVVKSVFKAKVFFFFFRPIESCSKAKLFLLLELTRREGRKCRQANILRPYTCAKLVHNLTDMENV